MTPEILAPAGNRAMADAAFAAGCDAIYCAAPSFGARAFADNFSEDELVTLISDAHRRGVRVFLTVNTLLHEGEISDAVALLTRLSDAGLDAAIVQDLGLNRRLFRELPQLERHASTQMSVTSLSGARELERLGFTRIILGRETSLPEVENIVNGVSAEVEVFVHGSLCVSVSGQCYLSAFQGGRSGNRGACAQPCRKRYRLERSDGTRIGEDQYLSPRDLMTLDAVPLLSAAGVSSLKIEGRMKKPEYVFAAVSAYRAAVHGVEVDGHDLALMTNRPFTRGFLLGDFGRRYAFGGDTPSGEVIGNIVQEKRGFALALDTALDVGDILMLNGRRGAFPLTVTEPQRTGARLPLTAHDVTADDVVRRVYTARVRQQMHEALVDEKREAVHFDVTIHAHRPISVTATSNDRSVTCEGDVVEVAQKRALDRDTVERAFQKLGQSHYVWDGMTLDLDDGVFLAMGQLNAARRMALEALDQHWHRPLRASDDYKVRETSPRSVREPKAASPQKIHREQEIGKRPALYLRTSHPASDFSEDVMLDGVIVTDVRHAADWKARGMHVEWEIPPLLDRQKALQLEPSVDLSSCDGFFVRTLNELGWAREWNAKQDVSLPLTFDYGMNVWNEEAICALEKELDVLPMGVTLSPELSWAESRALLEETRLHDTVPLMLYVGGAAPGMLMKHCPASLVKGCTTDAQCATCGFRRDLYLRDALGKRAVRRQFGYTEVDAPIAIDLRDVADELLRIQPSRIIVRDGETTASDIAFWAKRLKKE